MKASTLKKIIKNPALVIKPLGRRGILSFLSDETYLKLLYRAELGKKLNLESPKSFNEKMQWLKINDRNPEYIQWVDKISVKSMIEKTIGKKYVVPLIGEWNNSNEIDFDKVPDLCVFKCNHDQGSTRIYKRGESDEKELCKHLTKCLANNPYSETREWPYKGIKSKILCEPFLADDIVDYKIFCFNGIPRIVNIGMKSQKDQKTRITFLDMNWNLLSIQRSDFDRVKYLPQKPECFNEICNAAEKLAKGKKFVRIDFFIVDGKPYFSEFTLYPTSGLVKFTPDEGDLIFGKWLKL
ncbi:MULTISPECIES: ATP-grasp fold amidoligase family protein [Dorea]|jgi:hypothetical protein|uniref:ATP-grasp fold amidoligase family protein n=1 Tax=Dorea TaxID=189330 RepID=UPI0022E2F03A|nr:ATP-grasp fold amidoligase family protein [Dorea amylophila]